MEVAKRTSGYYQSRPQIVNDEGPMMRPLSLEAERNIFWGQWRIHNGLLRTCEAGITCFGLYRGTEEGAA